MRKGSQQTRKATFFAVLFFFLYGVEAAGEIVPVQMFSLELNDENFAGAINNGGNNHLEMSYQLKAAPESLEKCRIIGSISELDFSQDPGLQMHFTYSLLKKSSTVLINLYFHSNKTSDGSSNQQLFSPTIRVMLDFLVAEFPSEYIIRTLNMTSYQEHLMTDTDRHHDLLFFVNGFSNMSLSGNITHAYNVDGKMFTVHYMSCLGESEEMGWMNGKDYVLFTTVLVPIENMVQKFHLYTNQFVLENPDGIEYFYGFKGSSDDQIKGRFISNYNGVTFQADKLKKDYSYGITFLPLPSGSDVYDARNHEKTYYVVFASGMILFGSMTAIVAFCAFMKLKKQKYAKQSQYLKEEYPFTDASVSEKTRSDDDSPTRKEKEPNENPRISTVPEVEEGLQGSLRGSKNRQEQDKHKQEEERSEEIKNDPLSDDL